MVTEQEQARILLEHRKHGYSIRRFLRRMAKRYILSIIICVLFVVLLCYCEEYWFAWVVVGAYAGMFLRDIGWVRMIKKGWPFSEKVMDWPKIEALAGGEDCQQVARLQEPADKKD